MTFPKQRSLVLLLVAGSVLAAGTGCSRWGARARAREIAHGKNLFEMHCLGCHNGKIRTLAKRPPVLNGIFQRPYLPSGAPATDRQVRATIEEGRSGIMPPFENALSRGDIRDIIAYLHTLKATKDSPSTASSPS